MAPKSLRLILGHHWPPSHGGSLWQAWSGREPESGRRSRQRGCEETSPGDKKGKLIKINFKRLRFIFIKGLVERKVGTKEKMYHERQYIKDFLWSVSTILPFDIEFYWTQSHDLFFDLGQYFHTQTIKLGCLRIIFFLLARIILKSYSTKYDILTL